MPLVVDEDDQGVDRCDECRVDVHKPKGGKVIGETSPPGDALDALASRRPAGQVAAAVDPLYGVGRAAGRAVEGT
jgi:hypothetical protein